MKKLALSLGVAAIALTSTASFAADKGRVDITGFVYGQTCQITDDTVYHNLRLPDTPTRALANAGDVSNEKVEFDIKLVNCEKNTTAGIRFDDTWNIDSRNAGTLKNVLTGNGAAQNVNIQLLHGDMPINLNAQTKDHYKTTQSYDDTLIYNYAARYYATAQSKQGHVQTSATFKIDYK